MRVLFLINLYLCISLNTFAAVPIVDNNNGSWTDNFNDQLGSFNLNNIELDVFSGSVALAAGQTSGSQTTVIIDPPSFDAWQTVCLQATYSNHADLTIDVLNGADDSPIAGFQGIDMSQGAATSCLDISNIDINAYPTLKIRINHTKGATTPIVQQITVNWNPITFLLFDKVAPEEVGAGQSFPYKIRVSANFVDAEDLVIWDTLPKLSRGTVTYEAGEDYGQNDEPLLATIKKPDGTADTLISHNGNYTATAIMVNGVSVPEHSVYWTFDKLRAGKSIVLQAFLVAPNGTLDGTQYFNGANAVVGNGANKTAPTVATTVRSTPAPKLTKAQPTLDRPGQSRVFQIGEENLVLEGNTLRFYIKDPDGSTDGNDYAPELRERMYNTVLFDTLGDLLPYLAATPFDIEGTKYFLDGTNQIINGIYTTIRVTIGTTTVPANSVYWTLGTLEPGDGYSMDFKVTLNGSIPDQTNISNFAYLDSDQTDLLEDELPMIVVAEIPGAGYCCKSGYFPTYASNEQDLNCHPLDGLVPIIYGDPIQYQLHYRNIGGTTLQDMVFFDRVPDEVDFVSADFEDAALVNGTIYYYTNTDYPDSLIHPPFDYSLLPNPGIDWTTTAPATASDVTWVAWTIPQMSSSYFPPANPITQVTALMNVVTDANPPDPCIPQKIFNTKVVEINAETPAGGSKMTISPPRTHHYTDTTSVRANIGEFDVDATNIELTPISLIPGNAYYTINIKNLKSSRSDYFNNVFVQLDWTQLNVNGTLAYPTFINATGGIFTNFDPVNGTITLDIGALAQGEEKEVGMELNFPIGTADLNTYKITATLTGIDNKCDPVVATRERTALVSGAPAIQVFKDDVVDVIPSAGEIRYELSYRNIGESPSTNTWVTDRIPFRTTFVKAMAAQGEQVWFTDKLPPHLPANQISVINPIRFRTIQQHFSLGILDDNGTPADYTDDEWTSPFGDQTTWIAWKVDDPTYTPNLLPVNPTFKMVEMIVKNDDDGTGTAVDGSPAGTVIFNEEAIFSKQNLLAVGNEVRTTIEDFPGLELNKRSDVEIVTSAESFNWIIDYRNNSHATDDIVTITDNLPFEVDLNTVHHQWNTIAIANGQAGTNTDITANSNVTIAVNGSGSTTVEIKIAGSTGLKSDLLSEEGGTIRLNVTPKNSTVSGVVLDNEVCGVGQNALSTTYLCDNDLVTVLNPDLLVSKITSTTEPNSGDTVTYTLLIANRGLHDAEGVIIQDMLPTGATYITGSTQLLTAGYSVNEPSGTSTLIWNDLQQTTGGTAGSIPQNSADIYLSYRLKITGNVQDMPANSVVVSTTDPEDTTYPNVDTTTVLIPPPDPAITKTGQSIAAPGDAVTWTMDYYNTRNAPATGVYIIEALPDFDNDGNSDVDFINTIPPSGVTVYYSAITGNPPAFDASNPTSSGNWTTSTGVTVNHLAYLIGNMDANATIASIHITAALKDPNTGVFPPAGTTFSNQVEIFLNETEGDITNNRDTFETKVPGIDVSIDKTGSMEGGFPGLRPGDPISYTFTIKNNGTVTAHGLSIADQLPSNFVPAEPFDEFTAIEVYDAFGLPTDLLDPTDAAITIPIEPSRTGTVASDNLITWYLGTTSNTADANHYRNVGIPVGATLSFTINGTVAGDAKEGDKVSNSTTVTYEGIPSNILPEEFLSNNIDSTTVTIYRPDVMIQKSVVDKPTNDETWTEAGSTLTYNLEYNNIGNAGADNVVISEIIPEGTTYEEGTLTLPPGASVEWFPNAVTPTAFDITIPFLPAPANYDAEFGEEEVDLNCTDLNATMNEQVIEPVTGNTTIPAAPPAPAAPIILPSAPPAAPAAPALPAIPANVALKGGVTLGSCDCATQVDLPEIACEALVALYDSLDGSNWGGTGLTTIWGANNSPCTWTGVDCVGGQIDELIFNDITSAPLTGVWGNLPPELGNLSAVTKILFNGLDSVGGNLPPEWANLSTLGHLQISGSNKYFALINSVNFRKWIFSIDFL